MAGLKKFKAISFVRFAFFCGHSGWCFLGWRGGVGARSHREFSCRFTWLAHGGLGSGLPVAVFRCWFPE
jgi:hypothetical protein